MIATEKKLDEKNIKEKFEELLIRKEQEKSNIFDERFSNPYYKDDLKNLVFESDAFASASIEQFLKFVFITIITIIFIGGLALYIDLLFFIPMIFSFPFAFIGNTRWSKNRFFRKWIKNKDNLNIIKSAYFKQSIVDKETLKEFALIYGEEVLVNLLEDKEVIKYEDIIYSISQETNNMSRIEKRENLFKAVKCMTNE